MSAAFLGSDTYKLPSANKRLSLACSASSCSIKPGKLSYSRCSLKLSFLGAIVFEGVADALFLAAASVVFVEACAWAAQALARLD